MEYNKEHVSLALEYLEKEKKAELRAKRNSLDVAKYIESVPWDSPEYQNWVEQSQKIIDRYEVKIDEVDQELDSLR